MATDARDCTSVTRAQQWRTCSTLFAFRVLRYGISVSQLGKDGWNQIKVGNAECHGSFRGFDSDEARLANYAEFLITTDQWTE